jgi:hypothetical protein
MTVEPDDILSWERFTTTLDGYRVGILPFEGWAYGIRGELTLTTEPRGAEFRTIDGKIGSLTLADAQKTYLEIGQFTFDEIHDWLCDLAGPSS